MATEYVTHRDLEALRTEFRGEFALLRGELRGGLGELRGEIGELRGEIGERTRIDALPTTRKMWVANATSMIGLAGLVIASVRFAG